MADSEKIFHKIITQLPNGIEGNFFAAKCIKSTNGKTAAFLWKGNMIFKLDKQSQLDALNLDDSKIGTHLYAPEKQMKGWILIPAKHSNKWSYFAKQAIKYINK